MAATRLFVVAVARGVGELFVVGRIVLRILLSRAVAQRIVAGCQIHDTGCKLNMPLATCYAHLAACILHPASCIVNIGAQYVELEP
jgi:hypothetical protein